MAPVLLTASLPVAKELLMPVMFRLEAVLVRAMLPLVVLLMAMLLALTAFAFGGRSTKLEAGEDAKPLDRPLLTLSLSTMTAGRSPNRSCAR